MTMEKKMSIVESTCIPINIDNCNTDLIIPARYMSATTRDLGYFGDAFMHDLRFGADGTPKSDFVLNRPEYSERPSKGCHEIVVAGPFCRYPSRKPAELLCAAGYREHQVP